MFELFPNIGRIIEQLFKMIFMKRIIKTLALGIILMGCNAANDGDASTDTTNFNRNTENSTNLLGDTTIRMNDTGSYSNPNMHTGNDSSVNRGPGNDSTTRR